MLSRREALSFGAVSVLLPFAQGREEAKASACVFAMLQGGPSHHDLWDPKPSAPAEVRGPFGTIATRLPGVRFSELLPRTAALADRIAVVRSMQHPFTNHIAGTYVTLTGSTAQPDADREAKAEDAPGPGAILNHLSGARGVPASVSLPTPLSIPGPSNRMPGQYGGVLGAGCDPFLIAGEPHRAGFRPLTLSLPDDVGAGRLRDRASLRDALDGLRRRLDGPEAALHGQQHAAARELLARPAFREALDLSRESSRVRDSYGRTKFGQSMLLARRLVEAGVRFVHVNEFNQAWDTHGGLLGRYRRIVPEMEAGYAALVKDLEGRGMLARTLVVCGGEFGRTPTVNKDAGRDHWPYAYSMLLAGGGIRGGQVYGSSDSR
ncbi:MAG: DUF1501 domain-containing protein, partial [Gemmataceae bacterium]|nr:DUF1501 domain-containing protein [Gemmataceae bacterium]